MFTNGQQQNTQLIVAVLSCVQSAYLGDWLCVKLPFIFLKKYGIWAFPLGSVLSSGWQKKQGQTHSSQQFHC